MKLADRGRPPPVLGYHFASLHFRAWARVDESPFLGTDGSYPALTVGDRKCSGRQSCRPTSALCACALRGRIGPRDAAIGNMLSPLGT